MNTQLGKILKFELDALVPGDLLPYKIFPFLIILTCILIIGNKESFNDTIFLQRNNTSMNNGYGLTRDGAGHLRFYYQSRRWKETVASVLEVCEEAYTMVKDQLLSIGNQDVAVCAVFLKSVVSVEDIWKTEIQ